MSGHLTHTRVAYEKSRALWPSLELELTLLAEHVARLGVSQVNLHQHGIHLCLAFACAEGDARALAIFEREFLTKAHAALRRISTAFDFVDEAMQTLRVRLFVGRTPAIGTYAARASLHSWLRRAARNVAFSLIRRDQREFHLDAAAGSMTCSSLHEARWSPAHVLTAQSTFERSVAGLNEGQRALLRSSAHGLGIDQISDRCVAHRSTVARALAALRSQLGVEMRRRFCDQFALSRDEGTSLLEQLSSELVVPEGLAEAPGAEEFRLIANEYGWSPTRRRERPVVGI